MDDEELLGSRQAGGMWEGPGVCPMIASKIRDRCTLPLPATREPRSSESEAEEAVYVKEEPGVIC